MSNPPTADGYEQTLFNDTVERFIRPEVDRRQAAHSWSEGEVVYRFQVLFPDGRSVDVRLNDEVGGTFTGKATRPLVRGEITTINDFSELSEYTPQSEDLGIPHLTGFLLRDGWSMVFEFAGGHPDRHAFLELAEDFLASAGEALDRERLGVFYDTSLSACELLAKSELLSCRPTVDVVLGSRTHAHISASYNLWANLGNMDIRYAGLLNTLHERRPTARYLRGEQPLSLAEAACLFELLSEMHTHVARLARGPAPTRFNLFAARPLKAGEILRASDVSLAPVKQRG